jgi:hypothetical protein
MLHRIKSGDDAAAMLKGVSERLLLTSLDPRWRTMSASNAERAVVDVLQRCVSELRLARRARAICFWICSSLILRRAALAGPRRMVQLAPPVPRGLECDHRQKRAAWYKSDGRPSRPDGPRRRVVKAKPDWLARRKRVRRAVAAREGEHGL